MSEDQIALFKRHRNTALTPRYHDRDSRNAWAASLVRDLPGRAVLNIGGGGQRHLQKHLGGDWRIHEVDIAGDCDTKLNLDQVDRLPFADGEYDTVCGFDVLEHLEHFHFIASEMYRVARTSLLWSLPNAGTEAAGILRNVRDYPDPAQNGVYSKYYGLPLAPPEDRHRWWLSFDDIIRYADAFARQRQARLEFFIPDDEFSLKRSLFRALAGERRYLNFFCSTVWIRFTKPGSAA
ncbi:MAG TPA: methyltransferase domain-containing protein [Steroidobacteraceae bacterium]|nr:methyltransferase domain-containing protein [Steroidobacteraceae bacterium]